MSTGLTNAEVCDLYQRYGYLLMRRCRALLRDDSLAEDALQTVFLKLMRHGAGARAADSQLAFLYRVVERHCFDLMRERARRPTCSAVETVPERRQISNIEERSALAVLWSKLIEKEREVAVMLYNDGLSQEEASRLLGCSRQAVGKHALAIRLVADRISREPDGCK